MTEREETQKTQLLGTGRVILSTNGSDPCYEVLLRPLPYNDVLCKLICYNNSSYYIVGIRKWHLNTFFLRNLTINHNPDPSTHYIHASEIIENLAYILFVSHPDVEKKLNSELSQQPSYFSFHWTPDLVPFFIVQTDV